MTKKIEKIDLASYVRSAGTDALVKLRSAVEEELARRRSTEPVEEDGLGEKRTPRRSGPIARVRTFTDGASRGNPGHAGIGVLIFDENDEKILQDFRYIGECTNNEAEYRALLLALDRAHEVTQEEVECFMDSELVVRQITGRYAVKSEKMARFLAEVRDRLGRFKKVSFTHVPREHPKLQLADKLANRAIDEAIKGVRGA